MTPDLGSAWGGVKFGEEDVILGVGDDNLAVRSVNKLSVYSITRYDFEEYVNSK